MGGTGGLHGTVDFVSKVKAQETELTVALLNFYIIRSEALFICNTKISKR